MKISLVIPLKDEEASLGRLIRSISEQTRAPDEVIFVDAGSRDRTRDVVAAYREKNPAVRLVCAGAAYPGTARNAGVSEARHGFIAFTDGGIELDRGWLGSLSHTMDQEPTCDVVYGNFAPRADTFFKRCLSMAVVPPAGSGEGGMRTPFLASSLLKKSVWEAVGGFRDLRAAEDRIFMEDVGKKGFKTRYDPAAVVIWNIPKDLKEVFGRFYSYSYHDLRAKRAKDWHLAVLRMYAAALACIVAGIIFWWPLALLAPAGFALRVAKKIYINRREPYFRPWQIGPYFAVTGFLIFFIDLAMFAGWGRYLSLEMGGAGK